MGVWLEKDLAMQIFHLSYRQERGGSSYSSSITFKAENLEEARGVVPKLRQKLKLPRGSTMEVAPDNCGFKLNEIRETAANIVETWRPTMILE